MRRLISTGKSAIRNRWCRVLAIGITAGIGVSVAAFLAQGGTTELGHLGQDIATRTERAYLDVKLVFVKREQRRLNRIAEEKGAQEARADILKGRYSLIWRGGPPGGWEAPYIQYMQEKHGIAIDYNFSCIVSSDESAYAKGYNSISRPAIEERFGTGFLERIEVEFRNAWRQE